MTPPDFSSASDTPLVQKILEPLLDDFQYWFQETQSLLHSPDADCLPRDRRQALLQEIAAAQQQVATARTLLLATGGTVGIETPLIGQWHQLVAQCWKTTRDIRQQTS